MTYELIQMLIERNNLHEIDTWMFFKWVFKTFVAVMILTNTFNIVLAVFDVSQHVIQQSAGIIQNGTEITPDVLGSLRTELEAMELGPLFGLWLQSFLIQLTMIALNIVIFVIVYGRMIEIYLLTSLAPIPFATVPNRETGHMGQNYFRSLFAVGFQGLLLLVCVCLLYTSLFQLCARPTLSVCKQFQNEHLRLCALAFGLGGVRPGNKIVSGIVISSYPFKAFLVSQRKGKGLSGRRKGAFLLDKHPRCGAVLPLAEDVYKRQAIGQSDRDFPGGTSP